jgi:hypothetical protein
MYVLTGNALSPSRHRDGGRWWVKSAVCSAFHSSVVKVIEQQTKFAPWPP